MTEKILKRKRVANRGAMACVVNRERFITNNKTLFGGPLDTFGYSPSDLKMYGVFSYNVGWPLYLYDEKSGTWFGNQDKFSQTTTRHSSYARPGYNTDIVWCTYTEMRQLMQKGVEWLVHQRLTNAA